MTTPSAEPPSREPRELAKRFIAPSVLIKVRLYLILFVVCLVIAIVDAFLGTALTWVFVGCGLLVGTLLGIAASRMQRFDWSDFEERVVGRFDTIGIVVLVLYLVFSFTRSLIIEAWVPTVHVPATGIAVLAGLMFGQVLGIAHGLLNLRRRVRGRGSA